MISIIPKDISPFKLVRYGCRCAGLMNHEGRPWSLVITTIQILSINAMGITSILEILLRDGNLQNKVEAMSVFAIYIQINCKLINMLNREKDIRNLLDKLKNFHTEILNDEKGRIYLIENENLGRKLITFLCALFLSSPILSFISTSLNAYMDDSDKSRLTIRVWIPWNMDNFGLFLLGNALASIMSFSACIIYSGFATVQFTFTFQVTAYLRAFRDYLENNGGINRTIYEQHIRYIQLINDYNAIFAGQTYLEILVSSIMPCGFGFTLVRALKRHDNGQFDLIQQMSLCLASPCVICPCGQLISTEMERLHESSYLSDWYEQEPKVRKTWLMLMTMATKPTVLHYKKFSKFDHICMASVFQGLYSFFMMIINLDSE